MPTRALIDTLNNLALGEFTVVQRRVQEVRDAAHALGLVEITALLDEALTLLAVGEVKQFRKRINTAVSRLGHVKLQTSSVER